MITLSWNEIKTRASAFVNEWQGKASTAREEADAQTFETGFFNIFGIKREKVAIFEKKVKMKDGVDTSDLFGDGDRAASGYIDLFWKGHILIEMKTPGKDLEKAYEQAKGYANALPPADLPQGILICDFVCFDYYDLTDAAKRYRFTLPELPRHIELFGYLAGYKDVEFKDLDPVNVEAAERMGDLHDALKETGYEGHDLEVYLVRLLFCLFADDTGIFEEKKIFFRYIKERTGEDGSDLALHLERIFDTLNRSVDKRSKAIDEQLNRFPYVDGGLFGERLGPADFTSKMRRTLLECCALDWGRIKPEIFGAMFQSVMDKKKRRTLGEHYTSETNILKLIKPLFLDDLQAELGRIKRMKSAEKKHRLLAFHDTLCRLKFLDPACGCGNFLIVSYRALRLLEIETIKELLKGEQILDIELMVRVNVNQFYGIEIEDFPVQVARTAMWLTDHLMNNEASAAFGKYIVRIPLTTAAVIVHANAIPLDWESVVPRAELSYILGNPPFVGYKLQSERQKQDLELVFKDSVTARTLDYVTAWYIKAAMYIQGTNIQAAFVSTNSICQGEQAIILWGGLMGKYNIKINFAHQTFKWWNEARGMAAVYCVIVGFALYDTPKRLYSYDDVKGLPKEFIPKQINPYLIDADTIFIQKRSVPIQDKVPPLSYGSEPREGGFLILSTEEKQEVIEKEPFLAKYIKRFVSSDDFIHNVSRYCFWLVGADPAEVKKSKILDKRLKQVKAFREQSLQKQAHAAAETPGVFSSIRQPQNAYLLIPIVSSENRKYIPIGYMDKDIISSNANFTLENASLYDFGIITSSMHMAWMRYVCGRLKSDYRYSNSIVYNNFPWPTPTARQQMAIETAAQAVLDVRAKFSKSSLADLYDQVAMPPELAKAHQRLDKAVEVAYGRTFANDAERVAYLFDLYQKLSGELFTESKKKGKGRKIQ